MEKEIEQLRKEVDQLSLQNFYYANIIQTILTIMGDMTMSSPTLHDISEAHKYVHEHL